MAERAHMMIPLQGRSTTSPPIEQHQSPYAVSIHFLLVGNRRFRAAIDRNLDRYLQVHSRHEKSIIVSEIVGTIRAVANASMSFSGGGFVRKVRNKGEDA